MTCELDWQQCQHPAGSVVLVGIHRHLRRARLCCCQQQFSRRLWLAQHLPGKSRAAFSSSMAWTTPPHRCLSQHIGPLSCCTPLSHSAIPLLCKAQAYVNLLSEPSWPTTPVTKVCSTLERDSCFRSMDIDTSRLQISCWCTSTTINRMDLLPRTALCNCSCQQVRRVA